MKKQISISLILLTVFFVANGLAQSEKLKIYGILLDNTGTMRPELDNVKIIGKEIVKQTNRRGIISIFNFETRTATIEKSPVETAAFNAGVDWTQDENSLNQYIDGTSTVRGQTALLDTIFSAAEKNNSKANSEQNKFSEKILILITDGEDRNSKIKPAELIKSLKDNNIKVYAVGLLEGLGNDREFLFPSRTSRGSSKKFLETITKETGGRVVFQKSKQTTENVVKDLLKEN